MRVRRVLAAVLAAVALSPIAVSPSGAAPPIADTLEWTGHSSCGTVHLDWFTVYFADGYHHLAMSGTIENCAGTEVPGDYFVLASYPPGADGVPHFRIAYGSGSTTAFSGSLRMASAEPVCMASWYNVRMACLSVTASGSTWTAAPLSTADPSVRAIIVATLDPGDPKCATCWPD